MRPLRLEFQAFGSYPGKEVVDFEVLAERGLFVVTGPTGTGKTTVFDAMVYALFGTLPGGRAADDPRSHFAAAGAETYVLLDFEVDGVRYRVHRTPRQERPRQRGQGTTVQNPNASVVKVLGDATEAVETQATRCTRKCEELVGLDAKQFQRVVLLPQGKFTDFLIATDENREQLLRQLFGGELFEDATRWLKARMSELDTQVADVDTEVQHHRTNAVQSLAAAQAAWLPEPTDPDALAELDDAMLAAEIALLAPARDEQHAALQAVQAAAAAAADANVRAEAAAKQFDDAASAATTLEELEALRADIDAERTRVVASKAARPVVEVGSRMREAETAAAEAAEALAALYQRVADGFGTLERPVPAFEPGAVTAAVSAAEHEYKEQRTTWYAAQEAHTAAATAAEAGAAAVAAHAQFMADLQTLRDEVDDTTRQLEALVPEAAKVPAAEVARSAAQQCVTERAALDVARQALADAERAEHERKAEYVTVMDRFVHTQAPRLAEALVDGAPCPVCGSCEHPLPARLDGAEPVDHDEVDRARAAWGKAEATTASARTTVAGLEASLGDLAAAPVADVEAQLADAAAALASATAAAAEVAALSAHLAQRKAELDTAHEHERELATKATEAATHAQLRAEEAEQRAAAAAHIDADHLERGTWISGQLVTAIEPLAGLVQQSTVTATQLQAAVDALAEALATSGHASVDEAAMVLLTPSAESAATARIEQWDTEFAATTQRLAVLHEQGVPPERPDETAAREHAAATAAASADATRHFTTADNSLSAAAAELQRSLDVAAGSSELRQRRDTARIVFRTCNGEAGMRVKLERWVLAGELDRVTAAANHHLGVMTNHRYRLARNDTKGGGLTLEVFDSHTGRSRPTTSLSGGEQFQASLSLALGLADVVSHGGTGSGKQFEALFVDEGFGSLDPDALDDAIEALGTLRATGRMVGAITHVEAMKQALHPGIVVSRLPDGKGSTLKVNP